MSTDNESILQRADAAKGIYSITPFTLLDYPDKTACILWFAGCNMKCVYCYNPEIVFGKGSISYKAALDFLRSRKGLLDGVVLSGGECTLHKNLAEFIREIKILGLLVKIDTNGSRPALIRQLIREKLVDYIALDLKAPPKKYEAITGSALYKPFLETLDFLIQNEFPFEVRTTVHTELLNKEDIFELATMLKERHYEGTYYIQNYRNDSETIGGIKNPAYAYRDTFELNADFEMVIRS